MARDFYAGFSDEEEELLRILFGERGGGAFRQVGHFPRRAETGGEEVADALEARSASRVLSSEWWRGIWSRAQTSISRVLVRISRESGSRAAVTPTPSAA